ncbi:MAG: apolipoprotein N-acyltransferase [Treponema sp.]|jgi:apolipoprotein N-acyltransferase|nr:apolipoprotein N-acyltransferase [Treponema sp.]
MKKNHQRIKKNLDAGTLNGQAGWVKQLFIQFGLVLTAAILFSLSHPNLLFENGLPFLAWVAYIPVLILIPKNNIASCAGWGAIYGLSSYALFNYWLSNFHPLAGIGVYLIYLSFMTAVFLLMKLACIFFQKKAYIVQWIIWLAYEYMQTKGFLGFPYGITGYSQWRIIPLIQIASITGVWGVSALVTFPSFWLAAAFKNRRESIRWFSRQGISGIRAALVCFFQKEKISAIVWTVSLFAALVFGFASNKDYSEYPTARIALIQHATDPWEASRVPTLWQIMEIYKKDLAILKRLSDEALESQPKPDLVVWPETAFVPRIHWHSTYRDDQDSWLIVKDLLDYLSTKDVPFIIGNDDARMDRGKNPNAAERHRVDYNAAMLFENGINTAIYRKMHLVPFTEHFPYKKQLPFIYKLLQNVETHFWEKGEEETLFQGPGFTFSTPICFEDSFGYLSRAFVRRGADVLVNLTNDAWAKSLPSQKQHLSMAVFRAVENNRSMVRSTVSGQTCAIDPSGRIMSEAPPFKEAFIIADVPLASGNTIYTKYGDYLALVFLFMAVILLLFGAFWYIIKLAKTA